MRSDTMDDLFERRSRQEEEEIYALAKFIGDYNMQNKPLHIC